MYIDPLSAVATVLVSLSAVVVQLVVVLLIWVVTLFFVR